MARTWPSADRHPLYRILVEALDCRTSIEATATLDEIVVYFYLGRADQRIRVVLGRRSWSSIEVQDARGNPYSTIEDDLYSPSIREGVTRVKAICFAFESGLNHGDGGLRDALAG